jgi:hypothetical protein
MGRIKLSFTRGRPICEVKGGEYDGERIHLYDEDYKCCRECNAKCKGKCCDECCKQYYHSKKGIKKDEKIDKEELKYLLSKLVSGKATQNDLHKILAIRDDGNKKHTNIEHLKELQLKGGVIQKIPNDIISNGDMLIISGPRGSGKSWHLADYVIEYTKMFPKNPIYLIRSGNEDKNLDRYVTKVINLSDEKIKDQFVKSEMVPSDFKNSLVIFDDIDMIAQADISKLVYRLLNDIIETGRKYGIYCVQTSHLSADHEKTKRALNGANSITYMGNGIQSASTYVLPKLLHLDRKQINKMCNTGSRWLTLFKDFPMCVMYDKGVYLLDNNIERNGKTNI